MALRDFIIVLSLLAVTILGQSSSACSTLSSSNPAPSVASGWEARLIATGITGARSLMFDSEGHLLVVSIGTGILNLELEDGGGTCVNVAKTTTLIQSPDLKHGLALSTDGKTIYSSSSASVFSWSYDPSGVTVSATNQTLITGMDNADHTSRTLLMSSKQPGLLLVSRGSADNIDPIAESLASGHAQIRAFNVANLTSTTDPYDYSSTGRRLGWGLRNSVGLAEEPLTGGIYSVENSADQVMRYGKDVHEDNPGEEMNFHGFLNSSTEHQGGNYGYPDCLAVWGLDLIQAAGESTGLDVGSQFVQAPNSTLNDTTCADERVPPRLTFQAHQAPLDIIFEPDGSAAYVTFHGSWDRNGPVGYKVSMISFANGVPTAPSDSRNSTMDIFANTDNSVCPNNCFRPVGLARDSKGRIFMTSDTTNEIWVLVKKSETSNISSSSSSTGTGTSSSTTASPTKKNGAAARGMESWLLLFVLGISSTILRLYW